MNIIRPATLGSVVWFVLVHVFGDRLKFLSATPRSIWLSAAGGVSVAYVFVHLLPELAEHQKTLKEELPEDRQSRFVAFAVGGGSYAALLLVTA